jgi:hypothetical protein
MRADTAPSNLRHSCLIVWPMALDDAMTAYRAAQADARMTPTIIVRARERRQRRRVECEESVSHADLGRLAALRDELAARGIRPPELRRPIAPRHGEPA